MIIYFSLFLYVLLINSFSRPQIIYDDWGGDREIPSRLHVFLTMGMIVFIIGLRSTGVDTETYIRAFKQLPSGWSALTSLFSYTDKGVLFRGLGIICKTITDNYHFYLFVIAGISGVLVAKTLVKFSDYYGMSIALFMAMSTYTWMVNGIREFLAVCLLFSAIGLLVKRKTIPYVLVLLVAIGIHSSAIVMIPVYFIAQGKAWNKRTIAFLFAGIICIIFVERFTGLLDTLTVGTVYEGYTQQFAEDDGSSFIRTIIFLVPVALAFFRRKQVEQIASPLINVCINMSIVTVAISLIANVTSGILVGTVPVYFSMYNLILLPWLINKVYIKESRLLTFLMFFCYMIVFVITAFPYYSDILFGGHYFNALL